MRSAAAAIKEVQWNNDQEVVVTLQGELRMASVAAPRRHLLQLAKKGPTVLVIDLTEVSTIDTAGIAILVTVASTEPEQVPELKFKVGLGLEFLD